MFVKRLTVGAVMALIGLGGAMHTAHAEQAFSSVLPDMPLPAAFTELSDSVTIFDKPEGRLLDFVAVTNDQSACHDALSFYQRTLPHLGWKALDDSYTREGERLRVNIDHENSESCLLTFSLRPY